MGFWSDLGGALVKGLASAGNVEQTIEQLKSSPRGDWPRILNEAIDRAEETGTLDGWSQSISQRLSQEKETNPHLDGSHTVLFSVIAQRAARMMR